MTQLKKVGTTKKLPDTNKKYTVYYCNTVQEGMETIQQGEAGTMIGENGVVNIYRDKNLIYRGLFYKEHEVVKEIKTNNSLTFKKWLDGAYKVCEEEMKLEDL